MINSSSSVRILTYPSMSANNPNTLSHATISISSGSSPFGLRSHHLSGSVAQVSVQGQHSNYSSPFGPHHVTSPIQTGQLINPNQFVVGNSSQFSHQVHSNSTSLMVPVGRLNSEIHYQELHQLNSGAITTAETEQTQTFGNQLLGKRPATTQL
jgi:hypothetical protein